MKATLVSAHILLLLISGSVRAAPVDSTRVLKDTTTVVALRLDEKTVFCTDRGYGNIQLKVSVPDLDWLAHFDHRVFGEGLPCITGGGCTPDLQPGNILVPGEPIALASVRVILSQTLRIDRVALTCQKQLQERVESEIRGHRFIHLRSDDWSAEDYEKCLASPTIKD